MERGKAPPDNQTNYTRAFVDGVHEGHNRVLRCAHAAYSWQLERIAALLTEGRSEEALEMARMGAHVAQMRSVQLR